MYDPDQSGSGLLDILRGGTERFLTNIKDTSSKVIQSVARYGARRKPNTIANVIHPDSIIFVVFCLVIHHCSDLVSSNCACYVKETFKRSLL